MRDTTIRRMRRFYKEAAATPAEGGYAVALDGRVMRTPARKPLVLPTEALARAIAAEWQAQGETLERDAMPLTQLACTALDRVAANRSVVIEEVVGYARTDLVCYRASHPVELVRRQAAGWEPLFAWIERRFGATLVATEGIAPVEQREDAIAALRRHLEGLGDLSLAALYSATQAAGSLVIALALIEGRVDAEAAFDLAQLDETFQIERWGEDAEMTARRRSLAAQLAASAAFVRLCA